MFWLVFIFPILLGGCTLEVSLESLEELAPDFLIQERKGPDFVHAEVVTTHAGTSGYELRGIFGEISEKTTSLNGNQWQVEGVFYE